MNSYTTASDNHKINLDSLRELMAKFPKPPPRESLHVHPENLHLLTDGLQVANGGLLSRLDGLPVYTDEVMPTHANIGPVEFPEDRFVEYEPSDAGWCLALGIAWRQRVRCLFGIREPEIPAMFTMEHLRLNGSGGA